jgi:hypothetical protein
LSVRVPHNTENAQHKKKPSLLTLTICEGTRLHVALT